MKRVIVGLVTALLVSGGLTPGWSGRRYRPRATYRCAPVVSGARHRTSHCHAYWIVSRGQGNVYGPPNGNIWDGDNPPESAPPANLPPFLCRSEFPPYQCDAWGR
jgi:hypothetical protein